MSESPFAEGTKKAKKKKGREADVVYGKAGWKGDASAVAAVEGKNSKKVLRPNSSYSPAYE
eukprot:CAMPEP_0202972300 /NCGR_PEP_ID=MMETSP1396-20130829/35198_1 /ASSEMBLY_ACC=CAM_ASM_000872 /TAXON_ID= /ORGANISM="Pseudokeronopsis sp., Strain Brazil" /LENGTH=60 /DNA_ID=CAMNT_0049702557 /DNA_START=845 /DNA_END=1027 /DNA_ORIENTATION=+